MAATTRDEWGVADMASHSATPSPIVTVDALSSTVRAFLANIERIDGVGSSLALATGLTFMAGSYYSQYYITADGDDAPSPEIMANHSAHAALYVNHTPAILDNAMNHGRAQLRVWLLHHKSLQHGIETILSSQLVGVWTAIEVLASDLWEASLNVHPDTLADLSGSPKRIKPGTDGHAPARPDDGKDGREVPLAEIRRVTRGNYDLANKMGTLLKERFNFSILDGIRTAYGSAFSKNYANIDNAIGSLSFDAASIARNVLVHRAGIADEEYVRRSQRANLPKLAVGERFPLKASVSTKIIGDAVGAAVSLIKAVDGWLKSH